MGRNIALINGRERYHIILIKMKTSLISSKLTYLATKVALICETYSSEG